MTTHLAVVGAGHAHLWLLRRARHLMRGGLTPVLIAPKLFRYSGMASGVLSGALEPNEAQIDVAALACAAGIAHFSQTVAGIDLAARRLTLDDGAILPFDLISLNIGSVVKDDFGLIRCPDVWPVKPLAGLDGLRRRLELDVLQSGRSPKLVIAGSGPTAFEIAGALAGLCERLGVVADIQLIGPDPGALWAPPGAAAALTASLKARGLKARQGQIVGRETGLCRLASGETLACDHLVLATGLRAPDLISQLGLPTDDTGRLRTAPNLQSVTKAQVFAAGDCAVIEQTPRPSAGVFGVRAAPILLHNLIATARGRALKPYRPQARWLAIMDLGASKALALRGPTWIFSTLALSLKRRLDRHFIRSSSLKNIHIANS